MWLRSLAIHVLFRAESSLCTLHRGKPESTTMFPTTDLLDYYAEQEQVIGIGNTYRLFYCIWINVDDPDVREQVEQEFRLTRYGDKCTILHYDEVGNLPQDCSADVVQYSLGTYLKCFRMQGETSPDKSMIALLLHILANQPSLPEIAAWILQLAYDLNERREGLLDIKTEFERLTTVAIKSLAE
ncbi:Hypothetical protein POVR2_LOCUS343 [uncultured virus]|nr:Hypothetical protein POVR2_LOCUS343 [uncultured virus]